MPIAGPIGELLPIVIVAAGFVRRLIPTGNLESVGLRRSFGKQALLDRARDLEIVFQCRNLRPALRLAQRCDYILSNLIADFTRRIPSDE